MVLSGSHRAPPPSAAPHRHLPQGCQHTSRGFGLHQLGIVNLAGGVIQQHQQVVPTIIAEPAMPAPVQMQQNPWQGSPLAVFAPLPPLQADISRVH